MSDGTVQKPAPAEASRGLDPLRRHWAIRAVIILIPVIAGSVTSIWTAGRESKEKAQAAKDRAEAGYQQVDKAKTAQDEFNAGVAEQLQVIKTELAELRRRSLRPAPRRAPRPAPVPAITPAPPLPKVELAPNLDKALEQVQKQAPPEPRPPPPP